MFILLLSAITNEADKYKAERLIDEHEQLLYKLALKMLRDRKDAEDCVQETIVKVINNLDKIDESNKKTSCNYIVTICVNTANTMLKKRQLHLDNSCSYDELDEEIESIYSDPLDIVISRESVFEIKDSIIGLPEKYRSVIQLKETYELGNQKIAEMLDRPIGTIKIQLHRARTKLAEKLTKEGVK